MGECFHTQAYAMWIDIPDGTHTGEVYACFVYQIWYRHERESSIALNLSGTKNF